MYHVYADESCKDDHKYLILGGLVTEASQYASICESLLAVRKKHNTFGEVKWTKCSRSKLNFYKEFVDVFFERALKDELHFHSLVVDTASFNHTKWNLGDAQIGFNKLIYQLLLHRFGRRYGHAHIETYLDKRSAKDNPDSIRPMLNNALAKSWQNQNRPFRLIHFKDSQDCQILQLNDLLIGAIGFRKNGKQHKPDGADFRKHYAEYIALQVLKIQTMRPNHNNAKRFTIWDFRYNK